MRLVWISKEQTCATCLCPAESERAADFKHDGARRAFITARSTLRCLLAERLACAPLEVPITIDDAGKPHTDGCEFNLSHSGDWILLGISDADPVGVDVELIRTRLVREVAERFFSEREQAFVGDNPIRFTQVWTAKEAFLKALGVGIRRPLREIDLADVPESNGWVPFENVLVRSVTAPSGYAAAVARVAPM